MTDPLYGAKQSARDWNHSLDKLLWELGLTIICKVHYVLANHDYMTRMGIHVDDLLLAYRNQQAMDNLVRNFERSKCKMNYLGISQFLSIETA